MVEIKIAANQSVEDQLSRHLVKLCKILDAGVFSYAGTIFRIKSIYT